MKSPERWRVGDHFFDAKRPTVIYRVHRVHGGKVFYLPSQFGAYPARGIIRSADRSQRHEWVRVERNYAKEAP